MFKLPGFSAAAWLLVLALTSALSACGDTSLGRVRESGELRIGYAVEPPYAWVQPDGHVDGEAPAIARAIAARLGIPRLVWVQTSFDALIPDLDAGRYDVIAAGLFITPERARHIVFSRPTLNVRPALLLRRDAGTDAFVPGYLQVVGRSPARIAVISGAAEETMLLDIGVPEGRLVRVPDSITGWHALRDGVADAIALSAPSLRWMQRGHADDTVLAPAPAATATAAPDTSTPAALAPGRPAFAFRRADTTLSRAWDVELAGFIGTPEHLALIAPFGLTADDLPPRAAR